MFVCSLFEALGALPVTLCNYYVYVVCTVKLFLYSAHKLSGLQGALHLNDTVVPQPHLLHLSAERLSRDGAFLMDCGNVSSEKSLFHLVYIFHVSVFSPSSPLIKCNKP